MASNQRDPRLIYPDEPQQLPPSQQDGGEQDLLKKEVEEKKNKFEKFRRVLRGTSSGLKLLSIVSIVVAVVSMLILLRSPHHGRHHDGKWMDKKSWGNHHGRGLHGHNNWQESNSWNSYGTGWEMFKDEKEKRKLEKDALKFCLGACLLSICALVAAKAGSRAAMKKPSSWRLKKMFKKSIVFMILATLLIICMQIPPAFRMVESFNLNDKVNQKSFNKGVNHHKKKNWHNNRESFRFDNDEEEDLSEVVVDVHSLFDQAIKQFDTMNYITQNSQDIVTKNAYAMATGKGRNLDAIDDVFDFVKHAIDSKVDKVKQDIGDQIAKPFEKTLVDISNHFDEKVKKTVKVEDESSTEETEVVTPVTEVEQLVEEPIEEPIMEPIMEPVEEPFEVAFDFENDSLAMLFGETPQEGKPFLDSEDWSSTEQESDWNLTLNDWDRILGKLSEQTASDVIQSELAKIDLDDPFVAFIAALTKDELMEITDAEWRQFMAQRTNSQIKRVLDELDYEMILRIAGAFSDAEITHFMENLTEEEWYMTTPDEWQAMIVGFTSQEFKEILDEMTTEEILDVWSCFDKWMSDKFFDGLTRKDVEQFTLSEWRASFMLPATEFKSRFFDHMTFEEIMEVSQYFSDDQIDRFLFGMSEDDWQNMTQAEFAAFFEGISDKEEIIDFVNEMLTIDNQIVSLILEQFNNRYDELPIEVTETWSTVQMYLDNYGMEDIILPYDLEDFEVDFDDDDFFEIDFDDEYFEDEDDYDMDEDDFERDIDMDRERFHEARSQMKNQRGHRGGHNGKHHGHHGGNWKKGGHGNKNKGHHGMSNMDFLMTGDFEMETERFLPEFKPERPPLREGKKPAKGNHMMGRSKHDSQRSHRGELKQDGRHLNRKEGHHGKGRGGSCHKHFFKQLRQAFTPEVLVKSGIVFDYTLLVMMYAAYLTCFGLMLSAHRELEAVKTLDKNARSASIAERNQVGAQVQNASYYAHCKMVEQCAADRKFEGNVYQFVPQCEAPIVDGAFERQAVRPQVIAQEQPSLVKPLIVEDKDDDEERRIHQQYVNQMNQLRANSMDKI